MSENMTYEEAKAHVQEIRGFYMHLFVYVIISVFLYFLNRFTSPGAWWAHWPILGWGLGVALHGASIFVENGPWGKTWERRKIKELMGDDPDRHDPQR